jgi:hypothetical protein
VVVGSWQGQGQAAGAASVVGKAVLTLYPPLRPLSHNANPRGGAQDIWPRGARGRGRSLLAPRSRSSLLAPFAFALGFRISDFALSSKSPLSSSCYSCLATPTSTAARRTVRPSPAGAWDGVSQRNRGAYVGLETALLERTRHTARSTCERRTRPRCAPGPPEPRKEVARGGRRLGRLGLFAKPLPAPHSRAPRERLFRWQSKACA